MLLTVTCYSFPKQAPQENNEDDHAFLTPIQARNEKKGFTGK